MIYLLLLFMFLFGILNGLGGALIKNGLIGYDVQRLPENASHFTQIITELSNILKRFLKNKYTLLGIVSLASGFLFYQIALKYFPMVDVRSLTNLNVIFSIIFGVIICKERFKTAEIPGIVVSIIGILIVGYTSEAMTTTPNYNVFLWFVVIDLSFVGLGLGLLFKLKLSYERVFPFLAAIIYVIGNLSNKILLQDVNSIEFQTLISLLSNPFLYLFLGSYLVVLLFYIVGLKGGSRVGMFVLLTSIFTTILTSVGAVLIFSETLSPLKILGISLIFAGFLFFLPRKSPAPDVGKSS